MHWKCGFVVLEKPDKTARLEMYSAHQPATHSHYCCTRGKVAGQRHASNRLTACNSMSLSYVQSLLLAHLEYMVTVYIKSVYCAC